MPKIKIISPQQARDAGMFGPLYHGTTDAKMKEILKNGFKIFVGSERSDQVSNGYKNIEYAWGAPAPIHHLGFGIYFTTKKAIAKNFGHGNRPKHPFYITEPPHEINFGSPNTMMKWWVENGYDIDLAKKDRLKATEKLTMELKKKYKAIWFKGQGMYKLLDGDQLVVFDLSIIRGVDSTLSKAMEIDSRVEKFQEWVFKGSREDRGDQSKWVLQPVDPPKRGVITNTRPIPENSRLFHPPGANAFMEVKYDKGGRDLNSYASEFRPYEAKRAGKSKFKVESAIMQAIRMVTDGYEPTIDNAVVEHELMPGAVRYLIERYMALEDTGNTDTKIIPVSKINNDEAKEKQDSTANFRMKAQNARNFLDKAVQMMDRGSLIVSDLAALAKEELKVPIQMVVKAIIKASQEIEYISNTHLKSLEDTAIKNNVLKSISDIETKPIVNGTNRAKQLMAAMTRESFLNEEKDQPSAMKRWFGKSKVVSDDGEPMVVFHGTNKNFNEFKNKRGAIWFSEDPKDATRYTSGGRRKKGSTGRARGSQIYPVYLRVENPVDMRSVNLGDKMGIRDFAKKAKIDPDAFIKAVRKNAPPKPKWMDDWESDESGLIFKAPKSESPIAILRDILNPPRSEWSAYELFDQLPITQALASFGFDGVRWAEDGYDTWAVFDPRQVKSAIGNKGTFDPEKPGLNESLFTEATGEGKLIHVARWSTWSNIKKEGLKARCEDRGMHCDNPDESRVFLFEDEATADDALTSWMLDLPKWEEERYAAVIEVDASDMDVHNDPEIAGSYYVTHDIPASRLKLVEKKDLGLDESVLLEKKGAIYKHAVAMFDMPSEIANAVKKWQRENVDEDDIYVSEEDNSLGLENEIHTTILYGLRNNDLKKIRDLVADFGPVELELDGLIIFDNADNDRPYEVLNVKVVGKDIERLHKLLKDNVENQHKWPDFKPHICIGYLKKGTGKKYKDMTPPFEGEKVVFDSFSFKAGGSKNRKRRTINLVESQLSVAG